MAFPNITDIIATTIENRSRKIADNVTKNNVLFARLKQKGKVKKVSGGASILQELSYQENGNFSWYSGYDVLAIGAQDVISAASFSFKQAAAAVIISGLEQLQNSGKEKMIDLMESRVEVAEATMANNLSSGAYSDGTGNGGKQIGGLASMVVATPTTGVVGGIDRATWTFWRNQAVDATGYTATTLPGFMNKLWVKQVRGKDRPDLVVLDNLMYASYLASLQTLQRFTDASDTSGLGFPSIKYMGADVVCDGGIGGFCPDNTGYFLNTDYLFLRPHADRDMVPLSPSRRVAINQDAEVQILAWAGNMTTNNLSLQGYLKGA